MTTGASVGEGHPNRPDAGNWQAVSMSEWLEWDEWLATLDSEQHQRAIDLRDPCARFGARDPEIWARSEVGQDFAQLARFLALRHIWPEHIDSWRSAVEFWRPRKESALSADEAAVSLVDE